MFYNHLEFLSDTNEYIQAVSQAKDLNELLRALISTPAVWAPQIALASPLVDGNYTKNLRMAACDFSLTVLNNTSAGKSDDKYVVIRCSHETQVTFSTWQIDTRFGRGGTIKGKTLDRFIDAFRDTSANYYGIDSDVKGLRDALERLHSQVVILSRVVGTQKALEIFTKCVSVHNGFEVVDASGVSSRKFGPITVCRSSTGRRYRVGATASKKR
jgi:hypothetical protein